MPSLYHGGEYQTYVPLIKKNVRLAFRMYQSQWKYIDLALDLAFAVDIVLKFFTRIEVNGNLTKNRRLIARNYLTYNH
mgnify:CR=1 FL=1